MRNLNAELFRALALAITIISPLSAQEATDREAKVLEASSAAKLAVGSGAPVFKPAMWIQGEPVTAFQKDHIYLIECWATWCGPCVAAIPHVNALHQKFQDQGLVVIGLNVMEDDVTAVESFVNKQGDRMSYRVAFDGGGKSGEFARNWLMAAGANGIPHTFVVRENKLCWQGNPKALSEDMVSAMLAGTFDAGKAAADAAERTKSIAELGSAQREFNGLILEKKTGEAATLLPHMVELANKAGRPPQAIAELETSGQVAIAIAEDECAKAVALIKRNLTPQATDKAAARAWLHAAETMITTPGLAEARDYNFALDCLNQSLNADPQYASDPMAGLLKARALEAIGRKDECMKTFEKVLQAGLPFSIGGDAMKSYRALKDGKPWPKNSLNPDAKQ